MEAKDPCVDCPDKVIDERGYFCDIACGKRTAWQNYMAGIKEVVEIVRQIGLDKVSVRDDVLERKAREWQAKLKEWGISP